VAVNKAQLLPFAWPRHTANCILCRVPNKKHTANKNSNYILEP
jgi:hypothetical protein